MMQNMLDMDTKNIRYISESSNASTSGYSTMSQEGIQNSVNLSPTSSVLSSPAHSPATESLQTDFSNLILPPNSSHLQNYTTMQQSTYGQYPNYPNAMAGNIAMMEQQFSTQHSHYHTETFATTSAPMEKKYTAELRIIEQPVEKFRFRYKSEMHGTHGSLNGANSKRTPKTYPEVELLNFHGRAVIRCCLFQTNLDSPHSHQLVVRKDDTDICDPHDLYVSPENGFVAQFQNMGIIHTAKKYIMEELYKKKMNRLKFDLGREDLSTKQLQELHKAREKEAKDMNLNQVRLCFEAFKIEDDKTWSRIAAPVYTNPINNRKSAQTGELRIVRLSIAAGSVNGGDDLILLVEKVSKKNIKVRFFQQNEDDETIWEAYGRFRESDVHHQYAIVCQTPAYKDKDIDKPIEVNIELIRPSDDERSFPPVVFRYKPRDALVARKRRRTCSSATSSSSSSGTSVNSFEVPKTVQEQQQRQLQITDTDITMQTPPSMKHALTISEEYNKDALLEDAQLDKYFMANSAELIDLCFQGDFTELGCMSKEGIMQHDGVAKVSPKELSKISIFNKVIESTLAYNKSSNIVNNDLERIFKIYDAIKNDKSLNPERHSQMATNIAAIYTTHAEKSDNGDSLIHDIIMSDNVKVGIKLCHILTFFKQTELFNRVLNANNESGLHCACLYNRPLYMRPLLGLGCDPNIQNMQGNTALHVAVREQHLQCVDSFLNMKNIQLDLSLRNDDGLTALHLAIAQKNKEITKKLLDYNPAAALLPNRKEGNNALHMAVRQQRIDLVQTILDENNIDKSTLLASRNAAGHTALSIAKCYSNTKTGKDIAGLLSSTDDDSDREPGNLVIKEEEMSSSSADEEEFEYSSEVSKTHIEKYSSKKNLNELLNNQKKFEKISKILNENFKWHQLAKNFKMQKFLCLWSKAEDLLEFIKNKQSIDYNTFVTALTDVDRDALEVLLTPIQ